MAGTTKRALAAAIVLGAVVWPCIHLTKGDAYLLDLDVYRAGGRAVLHGRDLYAVRVDGFGFTYPPFAALLLALPALLPLSVAAVLMTLLSLAALAVVVRRADPVRTTQLWREQSLPAALVIAAMIAMQPVRTDLWLGQVNLVLAAMIMYDLLSTRPRRWSGALVGVAAAIKLTPAIFVLFLLLRGRTREAGNAVAGFVATTGLAAVLLPHDTVRYWTAILWHGNGLGGVARDANKSLLGVADRLFGSAGPPVWAALVIPIALAGLAIAARVANTGREAYALGIVGVTGCLVSPVAWSHHWVWFIPCLAGVATAARSRGRATQLAVALGALYFIVATQLTSPAAREFAIVRLFDANMYLIAGVALLCFAAAEVRGAPEATPSRDLRSPRSARTRRAWRSVAGVADPARTVSR